MKSDRKIFAAFAFQQSARPAHRTRYRNPGNAASPFCFVRPGFVVPGSIAPKNNFASHEKLF